MVDIFKPTFKLYPKRRGNVLRAQSAELDFSLITKPPAKLIRFGWAGPDNAQRALDKIGGNFPKFFIKAQTVATDGRRVVLWDFSRKVLGSHIPTFFQLVGDCVAEGASNAVQYLQTMEISRLNQPERYRPIFQPYIYGVSRVLIGRGQINLNEDGSLGIWAAQGVRKYGILAADEPGVPAYGEDVARLWGKKGPPQNFITIGQKHLIQSVAKVNRYNLVRDAIANGYPVTVASNRGFKMQGVPNRGKLWGIPEGEWPHQMVFIGVDDDAARPGCYCLNSWGPNAHGAPVDDAPPGGFWVDAEVVESMVAQDDSWAYSQFDGFPEQNLDFMLI